MAVDADDTSAFLDTLTYRPATVDDTPLLAVFNRQLIEDEGHGSAMSAPELEERMRSWLAGEYQAALFEREGAVAAYALYRGEPGGVYIRHLFVTRPLRRRGIATHVLRYIAQYLCDAGARLSLDVLSGNQGALAFYARLGFTPYAVTLHSDAAALVGQSGTSCPSGGSLAHQ